MTIGDPARKAEELGAMLALSDRRSVRGRDIGGLVGALAGRAPARRKRAAAGGTR